MKEGYIYILQNKSFQDNLIKIGRTTRKPEIRGRELYTTGVPESFHVSFVCQVGDCILAEQQIHEILSNYRNNPKREFFIMSIDIAKNIVLETCQTINFDLGLPIDDLIIVNDIAFDILENPKNHDKNNAKNSSLITLTIDPKDLKISNRNISLTDQQKKRAKITYNIIGFLLSDNFDSYMRDFSRDIDPEIELEVWENLSKSWLRISNISCFSNEQKLEALSLLLQRTMMSTSRVLKNYKPKKLTYQSAKKILKQYEAKPRPIMVR